MWSRAATRRSGWNGLATKLVRRSSRIASAAPAARLCGAEDHGDVVPGALRPEVREHFEAVDPRQADVEHQGVGPKLVEPREGVLAAPGFADVVAREAQRHADHRALVGFVFDDQDGVLHGDTGSRTTKRAPLPSRGS